MEENLKRLYEFGPFRLDAGERLLLRDGAVVPLTPKAFDVLLALVEQPGHLLEKDSLMKTVWPDSFVEENNLADNISRLRKALSDGDNGQKFIETIPKRGYRFVGDVIKQNGSGVELIDENAAPPACAAPRVYGDEELPSAQGVNSPVIWGNHSTSILRVLVLLAPVLIGVGLWQYIRLEKRAEVRQLEFEGSFYLGRWTEDEIRKGIENYNQAIALDPTSVSAYQRLAAGWNFLSDLHLSPREAEPKAQAAALKALRLDETSSVAHLSLGLIKLQYEWDWIGAEQEFKRAIALDPKNDMAHLLNGWRLIAMGRFDEAQAEMKLALDSNPLNNEGLWGLGDSFYFARQNEQAVEQYRRAIGVEPKLYWTRMMLAWAYEQQGKFSEAIEGLNYAYRLNEIPQVLASLGHVYALSGRRAEAQKVIADLQEIAKRRYVSPYDVATIYAGLGEKEQTMAWLEKAYEDRSGWLALWLKVDPKFDLLRADPKFSDLLRRIGHTR